MFFFTNTKWTTRYCWWYTNTRFCRTYFPRLRLGCQFTRAVDCPSFFLPRCVIYYSSHRDESTTFPPGAKTGMWHFRSRCEEIVYYVPREEKTWDSLAFGSDVNLHELWAGQFYSRGAYTIFPHIEAENAIFPFRSRARMRHFRPGVRKNSIRSTGVKLASPHLLFFFFTDI